MGMEGKLRRWALPLCLACIAVHALLFWSCGEAQAPGFLSIDCGSDSTTPYIDANNIEWIPDADMMKEGKPVTVTGPFDIPLATMRLFAGNQSKYCYSLSNNAVVAGALYLVRVSFWKGDQPPYIPKSSDGNFRFKVLIDADEWFNVSIPYDTTTWFFEEIYLGALHSSINVCLARSAPDGDAPFISTLELRPLLSISTAQIISETKRNFISVTHADYGSTSFTRYPSDLLDRIWLSGSSPSALTTLSPIDTSQSQNKVPPKVLQTSYASLAANLTLTVENPNVDILYYCVIYFAEIDAAVNASGQRVFNIFVNGALPKENSSPIDVFAEVGANAAHEIEIGPIAANRQGELVLTLSATATSLFDPFVAAAELFSVSDKAFSSGSSLNDVSAIEDLKTSMNLSSYTGDPCLPNGYGYPWLKCGGDTSSSGVPTITSISLSNYKTGGEIPKGINTLIMLEQILLADNNLEGVIPDMSALASLETLDLSNNKLSGSIPKSLETLKYLKVLNVENNNLSGDIPPILLQRKQASTLKFEFSGNSLCNLSGVTCTSSPPPLSSTPPPSPPLSSPPLPTLAPGPSNSKIKIGLIIGAVVVVFLAIGLALLCLLKRKPQPIMENQMSTQKDVPCFQSPSSDPDGAQHVLTNPPIINSPRPKTSIQEFTFEEIKVITNNFITRLGKGAFGLVYKGTLDNGNAVAIKLASTSSRQGPKEFLNEVDLLSRVHHKNLIQLLGYCYKEELVLVYELMPNGSLFDCLHGQLAKESPLSWNTRLQILNDAARGVDYLHHGCNPQIIHRDIKSSNVLLNDKHEAKISDFGISRNRFDNESKALATTLMGSIGYMDPEYLAKQHMTEKVDVYSFGVLIFEVVCGRRVTFTNASQQQTDIVKWIEPLIDRGALDEIVDSAISEQYNASSVWKVLDVALECVRFSSSKRPKMSFVYSELKVAKEIELHGVLDNPSIGFSRSYSPSLSFTHVHAR